MIAPSFLFADPVTPCLQMLFHYVPLHSSPAGLRYARAHGELAVTDRQAARLVRLPLWVGLTSDQQVRVTQVLEDAIASQG